MIGRRVATVSSSGPSMRLSTLRPASSGSSRSTGSSRASLPSSTSIIAAVARTGLVIEAIRKGVVRRIGSRQIRNLGTIAGNLATASPIGDTIPCLTVLDAAVTLASRAGERVLPLSEAGKFEP